MIHIIDLSKPSTKQAITELGINPNHLLSKELSHFQETESDSSIAKLRYDYFTHKQQEYLQLITEKIKTVTAKYRKSSHGKASVFLTEASTPSTNHESKDVQRDKFFKSLKQICKNDEIRKKLDKKIELSREARMKFLSAKNMRKITMEKLKEKQVKNYEQLKKEQFLRFKKYKFERYTPEIHENRSFGFYSNDEVPLQSEPDIEEKLKIFEEKMKKSEELHNIYINQKKLAIHKLLEKESLRHNSKISNSDSERLLKFIAKQKSLKERNKSLILTKEKHNQRFREKLKNRLKQAQKRAKSFQFSKIQNQKSEIKIAKSELNIQRLREAWQKKLIFQTEISKIKEEHIQAEQERLSNIQNFRKNHILQKHFSDRERLTRLSDNKHQRIEKTFKSLYTEMTQKEKYQSLIFEAIHLPHTRRFKQKLSNLA